MKIRFEMLEGGFQRPALAVEFSHPLAGHPAGYIGQDMDNRRPVSGGFMQLDAQAPQEVLVALVLHHFDALLRDDSRFRAATRAQRPQKLTREASMCAGDEA